MIRLSLDVKELRKILEIISKVYIEATIRVDAQKKSIGFYTSNIDSIVFVTKPNLQLEFTGEVVSSFNININSILNNFLFELTSKTIMLEIDNTELRLFNTYETMFTNMNEVVNVKQQLVMSVLINNIEVSNRDYYGMMNDILYHVDENSDKNIRCISNSTILDKMLNVSIKKREKMNLTITKTQMIFECIGGVNSSKLSISLLHELEEDPMIEKHFKIESLNCVKGFRSVSCLLMIKYVKIKNQDMLLIYPTKSDLKMCLYLNLV
jgi:hypothetical protein